MPATASASAAAISARSLGSSPAPTVATAEPTSSADALSGPTDSRELEPSRA